MKLLTATEMRQMDEAAIEKYGIAALVLMENAGRSVSNAVKELVEDNSQRVVIIAGKGNNGGDGFVAARHLCNSGVDVAVVMVGERGEITGHAAANFDIIQNMGIPIKENPDANTISVRAGAADIIVDAVLGTGLSGDVRGMAKDAITAINNADAPVVAVDIPSGIHADTGQVLGTAVNADVTVTFAAMKIGHAQYPGMRNCGRVQVADITIPRALFGSEELKTTLVDGQMAEGCLPERFASMHKGDAGRVVVVSGSVGMTGAATLCGMSALHAGAGLVYVAIPESLNDIVEAKCTEALTVPLPETEDQSISSSATEKVLELADSADAVAFGPGLSQNVDTADFVRGIIPEIDASLVVDADGLNCLNGNAEIPAQRTSPTVITPHPGEMARLLDSTISRVQSDRLSTTRGAAKDMGAVAVLKGAGTVIAAPEGTAHVNTTGNSGMASGGSGDILPGMIAAFIAGGAGALDAATAAVYYHGLAADNAAADGRRGMTAGDVLAKVREVLPD